MANTHWQQSAIRRLNKALEADESVLGLYLTGSFGQPDGQPDEWSDVDLTVVVKNEARERFCSDVEWLRVVGTPYATAVSGTEATHSRRVYLSNGKRVLLLRLHAAEAGSEGPANQLSVRCFGISTRSSLPSAIKPKSRNINLLYEGMDPETSSG